MQCLTYQETHGPHHQSDQRFLYLFVNFNYLNKIQLAKKFTEHKNKVYIVNYINIQFEDHMDMIFKMYVKR